MENYNCFSCGSEMVFVENKEVDIDNKNGIIWIVEKWECLECGKKEDIEITGKMTNVCRNA